MHLSPIQESPDSSKRSKFSRPAKLISPKGVLSNQTLQTPLSQGFQDERLLGKSYSPSKKQILSALTVPTPYKGNSSLDTRKLGSSVSASFQKSRLDTNISRDFTSFEAEFLPSINKQVSSQSKLREASKSISDTNGLVVKNMSKFLTTHLLPNENDWTAINGSDNVDEEMAKVRMLDAWQFEMMKEKVSGSLGNSHDITSLYKREKTNVQDNNDFPRVNVKLIQGILSNPEEKSKYNKGKLSSSIMTDSIVPQANTKKVDFGSEAVQSLENAIRENNQEILYELIQKKIKDFFFKTDIDTMTREQLKVHTKMIAESVIDQFKSLKGATNLVLIQNRIDFIISRLRHSKNMKSNGNQSLINTGAEKKAKIVVDYKSIEAAFIRNYQQSLESIKEYRDHIKVLNKKSYKLRNQLKPILKELEKLDETPLESLDRSPTLSTKSGGETTSKKTKRKSVEFKVQDVISEAVKMEQENVANSVEFIKIQKIKQERKKQRVDIQARIKDVQDQLEKVTHEIDLSEKELKAARNLKIHFRIQLKDLYYKMLKDETSLLDNNNTLSYVWIIRALWKMNEDVTPHSFPAFLDQSSIYFMINYAKLQDTLEKHCKQNNLMFLISSSDDFKDNNTIEVGNNSKQDDNDEFATPGLSSYNINADNSAGLSEKKNKDFHSLLDQFKNKMSSLKKVNLKAKKLTQVTHYNTKGKYVVSKWEDVDPNANTNGGLNQSQDDIDQEEISKFYSLEKSPTNEASTMKNSDSPLDKALEIIENLKKMREEEISRIIVQFLARDLDDKQKLNMKKIFRFLFARKEGEKAFYQCLKDKMSHDQKNLRQLSAFHQKAAFEAESINPYKLISTTSYAENQIWSTNKLETPFSGNEMGNASPKDFNQEKNNRSGAGDSVFKIAAARMLG